MTLYGYARDPSVPEPEPPSAHPPQPRSTSDDGPAPTDLWDDPVIYGSFGADSDSDSASPEATSFEFASSASASAEVSFEPVSFGSTSFGAPSASAFPSADADPLGPDPLAPADLTPEPRAPEEPPAPATVTARVSVPGSTERPARELPEPPSAPGVPVQAGPAPVSAVPAVSTHRVEPLEPAPSRSDDAELRAAAIAWVEQSIESDVPDVQPWDRRPLLVVLAAAAVLVLVAVLSGVASATLFRPDGAAWQGPGGTGTTPSTPGATAGVAAPPVASDTITMSGVGDVIMGTQYRGGGGKLPPNNGQGFFDPVKSALAADLVMGNLETPLSVDTGAGKCAPDETACFQFFLPPSYANYLKDGGFQLMNLANNHTRDMGTAGLANTRAALEAAGVAPTGAPGEVTIVNVKGVKVAVLGFSIYSWGNSLNNIPTATALVKTAAARADLVVIQMQGGAEGADKSHVVSGHEYFFSEDRGDLIAFSHAVIDAGADVVFGHGPHIMRGMEFYKGRLIAYSLGNFCGYGTLNSAGFLGVGGILKVTLHKDGTWAGGNLVSTQMVRGGMVDLDPNKRALPFVQGLSNTDFGASAAKISPTDGAITPSAAG